MLALKLFSRKIHYDYVICGGGSSGLALANRIAVSNYLTEKKMMVIDKGKGLDLNVKHEFPETKNRVFLTNPKSVELFKTIGIWDELKKSATNPIRRIEIWDEYSGNLDFNPLEKNSNLCYMVDNTILQTVLYKKFSSYVAKRAYSHKLKTHITHMKSFTGAKNHLELGLSDGSVVTTDILIGCDGANSKVRELAKIGTWTHDYNITDHVGTVKYSPNDDGYITFKKITHNGFVAFLTLSPGVASLSWCVNNPFGAELGAMEDSQFVDELNKILVKTSDVPPILNSCRNLVDNILMAVKPGIRGSQLSDFSYRPVKVDSIIPGSRLSYPLKLIVAKNFVKGKIVLVGDAAHRLNPITGQGLNLGLRDVEELVTVFEKTQLKGLDNYCPALLQKYNNYRRLETAMHAGFGTVTNYLFANDIKLLGALRSFGLNFANKFPLKDFIVNKSIG